MRTARTALLWAAFATPLIAEPAPPVASHRIAVLELGIFCVPESMGEAIAPGTISGRIHVPRDEITFHWPGHQTVPAQLGLAFGVRVQLGSGEMVPYGQVRVYRPGRAQPETWGSSFSSLGPTVSFFSFDREEELIPGPWRFEAWDAEERLYAVEFEIVPAATLPEITTACGAVS